MLRFRQALRHAAAGDGDGGILGDNGNPDGQGPGGEGQPGGEGAAPEWFLAEGLKGEGERPEWFNGEKYKTVAEQAKAQRELEKKLGGFTGAPDDYELSLPEGIEGQFDLEHPILQDFKETAKAANMSQETFSALLHKFVEYEASSVIADQAPKDAPIVVTCDGPRTRIYCLYDDVAVEGSDVNEDALGFDALEGDMTSVAVYSYTRSVTYVADNILKSFKDIIRLSGLDPTNLVESWDSMMLALKTWLQSGHLECVVLEVFNPANDSLIGRWDIDVVYGESGDGSFWTDTEQIKYHIRKAGLWPSQARYRLLMQNRDGRPDVRGWGPAEYRSTEGFARHSLGSTVEHNGLRGSAAYWRKT